MADIIETIAGSTTGNNIVDTTGLNNTNIETNVNNGSTEQNNSSKESNLNESLEQYKKDIEEQYKAKYEAEYKEKELMLGMTEAEKMAYLNSKEKMDLEAREKELLARELKLDAQDMLKKEDMPIELVGVLNLNSKEELENSFNVLKNCFQEALGKAINNKLRGTNIPTGGFYGERSNLFKQDDDPFIKGLRGK
ncbi:MAG: Phage minor structural protein GP20 [uncultured Clostridium sp.]